MRGKGEPSSAATASSSAQDPNVWTSARFGSGFFTFLATFSVTYPQATA
jgi:hypothetical protein